MFTSRIASNGNTTPEGEESRGNLHSNNTGKLEASVEDPESNRNSLSNKERKKGEKKEKAPKGD